MRHLALVTFPSEGTGVHFKRLPYVSESTEACLYENTLMVDMPIPREFLPYYARFCDENTRLGTVASRQSV